MCQKKYYLCGINQIKDNMESATVFNPMQLHLLRMFSYAKSEEQMNEIKAALSDYFFKKVGDGMDALEAKGLWGKEQSDAVLEEHLRTPYSI